MYHSGLAIRARCGLRGVERRKVEREAASCAWRRAARAVRHVAAHNVPAAGSTYLVRVRDALRDVQAGRVKPVLTEGYREFRLEGFSLLMAGGKSGKK